MVCCSSLLRGLTGQQQLVLRQLLKPVLILYWFGSKMFSPCLKIHNCPSCIWFYAKKPAFGCKSVFTQLRIRETQVPVLALWHRLEVIKFCIRQSRNVLNLGVGNCFPFPLLQLSWNEQVYASCLVKHRYFFIFFQKCSDHTWWWFACILCLSKDLLWRICAVCWSPFSSVLLVP